MFALGLLYKQQRNNGRCRYTKHQRIAFGYGKLVRSHITRFSGNENQQSHEYTYTIPGGVPGVNGIINREDNDHRFTGFINTQNTGSGMGINIVEQQRDSYSSSSSSSSTSTWYSLRD